MSKNDFFRDASGRLTFSMDDIPGGDYAALCREISAVCCLVPSSELVDGWDVVFQDYQRRGLIVGLEWDNWLGFTAVAKHPEAEPLVREIAAWLLQNKADRK